MKKKYITPKCTVIDIDTTEIIADSGGYTDK